MNNMIVRSARRRYGEALPHQTTGWGWFLHRQAHHVPHPAGARGALQQGRRRPLRVTQQALRAGTQHTSHPHHSIHAKNAHRKFKYQYPTSSFLSIVMFITRSYITISNKLFQEQEWSETFLPQTRIPYHLNLTRPSTTMP